MEILALYELTGALWVKRRVQARCLKCPPYPEGSRSHWLMRISQPGTARKSFQIAGRHLYFSAGLVIGLGQGNCF